MIKRILELKTRGMTEDEVTQLIIDNMTKHEVWNEGATEYLDEQRNLCNTLNDAFYVKAHYNMNALLRIAYFYGENSGGWFTYAEGAESLKEAQELARLNTKRYAEEWFAGLCKADQNSYLKNGGHFYSSLEVSLYDENSDEYLEYSPFDEDGDLVFPEYGDPLEWCDVKDLQKEVSNQEYDWDDFDDYEVSMSDVARHMDAADEWSYDKLSPEEKELYDIAYAEERELRNAEEREEYAARKRGQAAYEEWWAQKKEKEFAAKVKTLAETEKEFNYKYANLARSYGFSEEAAASALKCIQETKEREADKEPAATAKRTETTEQSR